VQMVTTQGAALLIRTRDYLVTGIRASRDIPRSFQAHAGVVPPTGPRTFPSTFSQLVIRYSLYYETFTHSALMTAQFDTKVN